MQQHPFYQKLAARAPGLMEPGRQAAVLLPFVAQNGQWQLLFEVRAQGLRRQPGEICLPGGMVEPGEPPAQAALREACEELLVAPGQLALWGAADVLPTPGGQTVYPFLAQLAGYQGGFSAAEVHSTFLVPAGWLMQAHPQVFASRVSTQPGPEFPYHLVPGGRAYPWHGGQWPVYFYQYQGRVIWGITAKVVYHALDMVRQLGGLPPVPGGV